MDRNLLAVTPKSIYLPHQATWSTGRECEERNHHNPRCFRCFRCWSHLLDEWSMNSDSVSWKTPISNAMRNVTLPSPLVINRNLTRKGLGSWKSARLHQSMQNGHCNRHNLGICAVLRLRMLRRGTSSHVSVARAQLCERWGLQNSARLDIDLDVSESRLPRNPLGFPRWRWSFPNVFFGKTLPLWRIFWQRLHTQKIIAGFTWLK